MSRFVAVNVGDAVEVKSVGFGGETYSNWCEVLGEPGVDRKGRGEYIAYCLALGEVAYSLNVHDADHLRRILLAAREQRQPR